MPTIQDAAAQFLTKRRVAVTGVSANPQGHGSNAVYTRMRERGYEVFAVNPNSPTAEGDPTYPDLASIPGGVEAVVIGTRPDHAEATMREAIDLGIQQVWMHRAFGGGSVSEAATAVPRDHGHRRWLPADVRGHLRRRSPVHVPDAEVDRQGAEVRLNPPGFPRVPEPTGSTASPRASPGSAG
jgi:predicted CoA-binding protein